MMPLQRIILLLMPLVLLHFSVACTAKRPLFDLPREEPRYIRIEPVNPLLEAGASQKFFAWGVADDGYEVILPAVNWTVDDGSIDSNGLYRAPSSPSVAVIGANWEGIHGHTTAKILAPESADSLRIDAPQRIQVGSNYRFRAFRQLSGGGEMEIIAVWEAGIGRIDPGGNYSAPVRSGRDHVSARADGLLAVHQFDIHPGTPVHLWVQPSRVTIAWNGGQKFSVSGIDRYGNVFPTEARFSTDAGWISTDGSYFPGQDNLSAIITAEASGILGRAELSVAR